MVLDMQALMPRERPKLAPCCKNKKPWMEGTLDTVYRGDFVNKEVVTEKPMKPGQGMNLFGPKFDGTTTMGNDFKVWETRREGPIKPSNTKMSHDGPFQGLSTYAGDFGPKEAPYHLAKPKHAYTPNKAPFEANTTHRSDFVLRETVPAPKAIVRGTNIPTSAGPFEGQSLYAQTFAKQPYSKRDPFKQAGDSDVIPRGQFDDSTMYGTSFVPKELPHNRPVRPQDCSVKSEGWYGGLPSTEYRGQFPTKEGAAAQPIRQARSMGVLPSGRFDGTTTMGHDFVPFETARTGQIRPSPAFETEKLPFTGQSTYKGSFVPKEVTYELVKPKNAYQPNKAPFDGTTTHKEAFVQREVVPPPKAIVRQTNIPTSNHPFEGQSTYKDNFTKMPNCKRRPMVPHETQRQAGPFDGTTTYHKDFVPKEIPAPYHRRRDDECESCVDGIPGVTCRELDL